MTESTGTRSTDLGKLNLEVMCSSGDWEWEHRIGVNCKSRTLRKCSVFAGPKNVQDIFPIL